MGANTTVVFADLTGSTGVFETLGNTKAAQAVTRLIQWIRTVCEAHGGRVVKTLGDGVLAVFPDGAHAVDAVVQLQRDHQKRIRTWPPKLRMRLQVGVACGEIVEVDGDCYGDAVNVASRLSDLSGADQIWANDAVIRQIDEPGQGVRFRNLGPIALRGKTEPDGVFRIEWQEEMLSEMLTKPGSVHELLSRTDALLGRIELSWLDVSAAFQSTELPVHLGRAAEAQFVISEPRVSRLHARIDWHNGAFVLSDLSSYGTWVRFAGSDTELALRRNGCMLHGKGEIALGASFSDSTVPIVSFDLSGGAVELAHLAGSTLR